MSELLGYKVGMTHLFDDDGVVTPVTVIQAGPCFVTQIKTQDQDGYDAIQIIRNTIFTYNRLVKPEDRLSLL